MKLSSSLRRTTSLASLAAAALVAVLGTMGDTNVQAQPPPVTEEVLRQWLTQYSNWTRWDAFLRRVRRVPSGGPGVRPCALWAVRSELPPHAEPDDPRIEERDHPKKAGACAVIEVRDDVAIG
jgi:hypothetical protein